MLCEKCNENEATIHIVKMTPEGKEQLNLCPVCAKKYQNSLGGQDSFPMNNSELIKQILNNPAKFGLVSPDNSSGNRACPRCGTTLKQIQQHGFAGCDYCYEFFGGAFRKIIQGVQKNEAHRGKIPREKKAEIERKQEISRLRSRIEELVKEENYEEAAQVRDRIKHLEKVENDK